MKQDQIQISYEEMIDTLPPAIEKHMVDTISQLLKEANQQGQALSLYFCSTATITRLNGTYRDKNTPTDLLSWLYETEDTKGNFPNEPWGELVYCLDVIRKQASDSGWELQDELVRLTVHGLVHLMGYDHESDTEEAEMLGIEKKLLKQIGLTEVYPA